MKQREREKDGKKEGKGRKRKIEARLLIVGRTVLGAGQLAERQQAYEQLQELAARVGSEVRYEAVELGELERLQEVVKAAEQEWRCELAGVLHLAGSFHQ